MNIRRSLQALKRKKWAIVGALAAVAIAFVLAAAFLDNKAAASGYQTATADRESIEVTISATGTVQAVTTVQVGSQASGTVSWLGADFNSKVQRGQVIARLDASTYQAQVDTARANLQSAEAAAQSAQSDVANQQANVNAAAANLEAARVQSQDARDLAERDAELGEVIARRDIESAKAQANAAAARVTQASAQVSQARSAVGSSQAKVAQANAQIASAKAQLDQAVANLQHTEITSPVDGVVVSRNVDVGQTVAASLQAPTLFTIAADLTHMQVLAAVDEADVGPIHEGLAARFTVDAFPDESFSGRISQVRLAAQTLQNVVTYTAVIDVDNPGQKLMPGMTANITVPVQQRENVLVVPNAALRFKPEQTGQQSSSSTDKGRAPNAQQGAAPAQPAGRRAQAGQAVWVLKPDGKLERRTVHTGLTDGRVTEILDGSELAEGEVVVIGQGADDKQRPAQQPGSPFAPRFGGNSRSQSSR